MHTQPVFVNKFTQKANPNATNSELDAKIIIKYDENNQPEDWEDFWCNSIDLYPTKEES